MRLMCSVGWNGNEWEPMMDQVARRARVREGDWVSKAVPKVHRVGKRRRAPGDWSLSEGYRQPYPMNAQDGEPGNLQTGVGGYMAFNPIHTMARGAGPRVKAGY